MKRRRFIKILAGVSAFAALPGVARALSNTQDNSWRGVALGAEAYMRIDHPQAREFLRMAQQEITRLERIFSLYRVDSSLSRLNAKGVLEAPPLEFLELLQLCSQVHKATGGLFDPTIQALWQLYANHSVREQRPSQHQIHDAQALVGFDMLRYDASSISFARKGMAMTLNGIAQGFIADKVSKLLRENGVRHALVETGEIYALGSKGDGATWRAGVQNANGNIVANAELIDMAIATSGLQGTRIDARYGQSHILNPQSGLPAHGERLVSVSASSAALADGLSTGCCLMQPQEAKRVVGSYPNARLVYLS
ncbi:FAD:protein FMN transferase [Polycladidibacter hongkongensis]|uniref:FAD:protein FMN transferase n=1 Tax=Polycladidibacter hongkongensis TaxID=1647556 RepID=UPI000835A3AD|nr:FAD:protein FMN transferase [Pseudovibrio hongkongensis]